MDLQMNKNLIPFYNSESQRIRVMSELWAVENMFCPCCGNTHISKTMNNTAVADFICDNCGEIFELKSKKGAIGNKIVDGAYETMIKRIVIKIHVYLSHSIQQNMLLPILYWYPNFFLLNRL